MTDDRIKAAQEEIQKILVAKPEYVVNTSEFNDCQEPIGDAAQPSEDRYGEGLQPSEPAPHAGRWHQPRGWNQ
jgi:hypothetical protein